MQGNKVKNSQASEQALQDSQRLTEFLNGVPHGDYRDVVNMIIEKCMINYTTFNNWRAGKCRIPELYMSTINIIANRSVF